MASLLATEVNSKLQTFSKHFVHEYEEKLSFYNQVLHGKATKRGKTAGTSGIIGQGIGGGLALAGGAVVGRPAVAVKSGAIVGEAVANALGDWLGNKDYCKKVKTLSPLVRKWFDAKAEFRKLLVEAAVEVFCGFERQFVQITSDVGYEKALACLAQDAVNRSINYFVNASDTSIQEWNVSIAMTILLGRSKIESFLTIPVYWKKIKSPGKEIIYKNHLTKKTWNTASLYEKVGIVIRSTDLQTSPTYLKKCDGSSKTGKYGYRRLMKSEEWDLMKSEYCEDDIVESESGQFTDYCYEIDINDVVQVEGNLLDYINKEDPNLLEVRLTAKIESRNNSISDSGIISVYFKVRKPVKSFTGRDEELLKLHNALLNQYNEVEMSQIACIRGLGGVGKSELARKYSLKYAKDYNNNIIWIKAENKETLKKSFDELFKHLDLNKDDRDVTDTTLGVYAHLKKVKCLFIFDNAVELRTVRAFFPSCCIYSINDIRPSVMITSRNRNWNLGEEGEITVIHLKDFTPKEAEGYVKTSLKQFIDFKNGVHDESVRFLSKELLYFPLALAQATAYIREQSSCFLDRGSVYSVRNYIEDMKLKREELFDYPLDCDEERYNKTVFCTWNMTMEAIAKVKHFGEMAIDIFRVLAYLEPDDINFRALSACYQDKYVNGDRGKAGEIQSNTQKLFWSALELLARYSMVELRKGFGRIHRLVQEIMRIKLKISAEEKHVLERIIIALSENIAVCAEGTIKTQNSDTSKSVIHVGKSDIIQSYRRIFNQNLPLDERYDFNNTDSVFNLLYEKLFATENLSSNDVLDKIQDYLNEIIQHTPASDNTITQYNNTMHMFLNLREVIKEGNKQIAAVWKHAIEYNSLTEKFLFSRYGDNLNSVLHFSSINANKNQIKRVLEIAKNKHPENFLAILNAPDSSGRTSLHLAMYYNKYGEIIEYLVELGSDPNKADKDGITPFHIAANNQKLEMLKLLILKGGDANRANNVGLTPLHEAAIANGLNEVKFLTEEIGMENLKPDKYGNLPFQFAAANNNRTIIDFFAKNGGNLNKENCLGETCLHNAVRRNDWQIVKCIIDNGGLVNKANLDGEFPLHLAVRWGDEDRAANIIKILIENGADVDCENQCMETPLHIAAAEKGLKIAEYLIQGRADVNKANWHGDTPLHLAAAFNSVGMVKLLIKSGSSMKLLNKKGENCLHSAAVNNNLDTAKYLVDIGIDITQVNKDGPSACECAFYNDGLETAAFLTEEYELII